MGVPQFTCANPRIEAVRDGEVEAGVEPCGLYENRFDLVGLARVWQLKL